MHVEEMLKVLLQPHHHRHNLQQQRWWQEIGLPLKRVSGRHQLDGRTVLGVELRVPATMTLYQSVFLRLDVHRAAHVTLVVPNHYIALQLTYHSSPATRFTILPAH